MERRGTGRLPFEARVDMAYDEPAAFSSGFSTNLARGGIFVAVAVQPAVGTKMSFTVKNDAGEGVIHGRGEVVWVRRHDDGTDRPAGVAVAFTELDQESRARLSDVLGLDEPKAAAAGENQEELDPTQVLLAELGIDEGLLARARHSASTARDSRPQPVEPSPARGEDGEWLIDALPPRPPDEEPAGVSGPTPPAESDESSASILVRAGLEENEPDRDRGSRRSGVAAWIAFVLLCIAAVLVVMHVVGVIHLPVPLPTLSEAEPAPPAAASGQTSAAMPASTPAPTEAPVEEPVSEPVLLPTSQPAIEPTPAEPAGNAAPRSLRDVSARIEGQDTVVTIVGDAPFPAGVVRHFAMEDPPRHVFRLTGLDEPYRRHAIEVGSPQLERIRIGLHLEEDPPEMVVVLDLTGRGVEITDVQVDGADISLRLSGYGGQ